MGEMADYMINGDDCQVCGVPIVDRPSPGHPRSCKDCDPDSNLTLIYDATEKQMRDNGFTLKPEGGDD